MGRKKRVLLGVSASIAAYKAAELTRLLVSAGHDVRVVMTPSATHFVAPMTFQALSGHPVALTLLDGDQEASMGHVALARWADLVVIAPASANLLADLAVGRSDRLLTALALVTTAPLWLAPAMNSSMWAHPATRANCVLLAERGARFLDPGTGGLACGERGEGRLLAPEHIMQRLFAESVGLLSGVRVLLTAGPTREAIDAVRYITNRSSGKMGYALARAMVAAGAEVCLVSGPVSLPLPDSVDRLLVESAGEMHQAVMIQLEVWAPQIFVACAAVSDYRMEIPIEGKLEKNQENLDLHLIRNVDILTEVAALPPGKRPYCVGFAAEAKEVNERGEAKRRRKGADLMAINRVGDIQGGFDSEENALRLSWDHGHCDLPMMPKADLAEQMTQVIAERYIETVAADQDS